MAEILFKAESYKIMGACMKVHSALGSGFPEAVYQEAPAEEQTVCVTCGMCCDGTLFLKAPLGEMEPGNLPEKIEENSYCDEGRYYFRLPCSYFIEKCTIYNSKRADVCSSYRCQLLRDLADNKITMQTALRIVMEALKIRDQVMKELPDTTGQGKKAGFRQILVDLGKIKQSSNEKDQQGKDHDMIVARCNIFEALLLKRFMSAGDFEKMIIMK